MPDDSAAVGERNPAAPAVVRSRHVMPMGAVHRMHKEISVVDEIRVFIRKDEDFGRLGDFRKFKEPAEIGLLLDIPVESPGIG